MRHILKITVVLSVLAGVSVGAALLGLTGRLPNTTFSNPSGMTYAAADGAMHIRSTPVATRFDALPTPQLRLFDATVARSLDISIVLNPDGSVASGVTGDDLVLRGRITAPDGTVYDGTGVVPLLTGEILDFGFADGAVDLFDFRFSATGGAMSALYAGQDIAVSVQSDISNTFTGVFTANFSGNAKGNLGPTPQIPQCRGTIGDFVWHDENRNGIQDPNEHGINGVTVTLTPTNPAGSTRTTVTGPSPTGQAGYYQFGDLCVGEYSASAATPAGTTETISHIGAPDTDSNGSPTTIVLPTDNSSDQTIDFGFVTECTGTIGDYVWQDLNDNGIQDADEAGVNGVVVQLFSADESLLASTVTSNSPTTGLPGFYLFDGLCAGAYQVKFFKPDTFDHFSLQDAGGDDALDSDPDATTGIAAVVLPADDVIDLTIDAGLVPAPPCAGTIGDFVWNDTNGNGIQDADEPGVNGVLVELKDEVGTTIQSTFTTTNAGRAGYYQFRGMACDGSYTVWVTRPAVYSEFSPTEQGADRTIDSNGAPTLNGTFSVASVALDEIHNSDQTIDFGFYACAGIIGDFVWNDLNANGIQDPGEPGIPNVTLLLQDGAGESLGVTAQTDASGYYQFTGLCAGDYRVVILSGVPSGFTASPSLVGSDRAVDSNGSPTLVSLPTDFASDLTVDFGFWQPSALGDFTWHDLNANGVQDAGEPGFGGVAVSLYTCADVPVTSTTTGPDGSYLFSNLVPGCYYAAFGTLSGYLASPANAGGDDAADSDAVAGVTGQYTLAPGEVNLTVDAGFHRPASLGDFVWNDLNANGIQDGGEPGVSSVSVTLYECAASVPTGSQTTDAAGLYLFNNLRPGCYYLTFGTPAGFVPTAANQGSDITDSDAISGVTGNYVLNSGDTDLTVDAGFVQLAGLGDRAWHDLNANGTQDGGEPGISGVLVTLLRCDSSPTGLTQTTNGSGLYLFANLTPGCYKVQFGTPAGFVASPGNVGNDATDSDSVGGVTGNYTLAAGEANLTVDAGFYQLAKLGDFVWKDTNSNGLQDSGEPGIPGVAVTLLHCDGIPAGPTATTGAAGQYLFSSLVPSCYRAQFATPAGLTPSPSNVGSNDAIDSDALSGVTGNYVLNSGDVNLTADAGFFAQAVCIPTTFDFTKYGSSAVYGTAGNIRTFSANGINVKASAFGQSKTTGAFSAAYLGVYSSGLGVTDSVENGSNNTHVVDNAGQNNYVLFEFSQAVTVDRALLAYIVGDSDITVWVGTVSNAYNNHQTLSTSLLNSLAFTEVNLGSSTARTADINDGGVSGNVLVIAAKTNELNDGFKLAQLTTVCLPAVCQTAGTLTLTGATAAYGTAGNIRAFSMNSGAVNVKASAFSRTDVGSWATAYLGAYGPGLGVTDGSEGDGSNDRHKVDNIGGRNNFVLLEFSKPVVLDRLYLDAVGADSDVSVWMGTKTDPYNNHLSLSDALLNGLVKEDNSTPTATTGARWADVNAGLASGNVVVVSAVTGDTSPEDAFKLSKLALLCK